MFSEPFKSMGLSYSLDNFVGLNGARPHRSSIKKKPSEWEDHSSLTVKPVLLHRNCSIPASDRFSMFSIPVWHILPTKNIEICKLFDISWTELCHSVFLPPLSHLADKISSQWAPPICSSLVPFTQEPAERMEPVP